MSKSDLLYGYVPIITKQRNDDGTYTVFGKAAGPDLDHDRQIMNEEWMKTALPGWFSTGANVREQHSQLAAGRGVELTNEGDDWFLKSLVVDPGSCAKLEHGVLQGYSVGIKNGKILTKSARAPKGEIVGGDIVEVSLVDRPANETCRLTIVKSVDGVATILDEPEYVVWDEVTKSYVPDVEKVAGGLPPLEEGGPPRFPIKNASDLHKAMRALGRVKSGDKQEVIAHIKARAKALGLTDQLTDTYKVLEGEITKEAAAYAEHLTTALRCISELIVAEAQELANGEDERCDISQLLNAVYSLWCFWESEASEGEVPAPSTREGDIMHFSEVAELVKAATAEDATNEDKTALEELRKAVLGDSEFISKADHEDIVKSAVTDATKALEERLETVEKSAAPTGPVKSRTAAETIQASAREDHITKAAAYDSMASQVSDRELADSYRSLAKEERGAADRLRSI